MDGLPRLEDGYEEMFLWDLTGSDVRIDGKGGLVIEDNAKAPIISLHDLENRVGRPSITLDPANLRSNATLVAATIEVNGGQGTTETLYWNNVKFVKRDVAQAGGVTPVGTQSPLADLLQVTMAGRRRLIFISRTTDGHTVTEHISVDLTKVPGAAISLTNMCAAVPEKVTFDYEFGDYYELLTHPVQANRLVPLVEHLGDAADCDIMARISYN